MIHMHDVVDLRNGRFYRHIIVEEQNKKWFVPRELKDKVHKVRAA